MAESNWYWSDFQKQTGPVTPADLARLARAGTLKPEFLVWKEGMTDWIEVQKIAGLAKFLPGTTPASNPPGPQAQDPSIAIAPPPVTRLADAPNAPPAETSTSPATTRVAPASPSHAVLPTGSVRCPHCSGTAVAGAEFCSSCGMALPSLVPVRPRIISGKKIASTGAGLQLQSNELLRSAKRAAQSLLTIGIINLVFVAITLYTLTQQYSIKTLMHSTYFVASTSIMGISGLVFVGLYFLARIHPLSATITALAVYVARWIGEFLIAQMLPHHPQNTQQIFFYRIITVVYLIGGVAAALKHRRLEKQAAAPTAPVPVAPLS